MPVTVKFPTAGITANLWGPNKTFEVEDLVLISGHVYRCCLPHTSSPSFKDDSLVRRAWVWLAKMG
jgi:hypothetical protein